LRNKHPQTYEVIVQIGVGGLIRIRIVCIEFFRAAGQHDAGRQRDDDEEKKKIFRAIHIGCVTGE
jgi:hypothetical protein